MITITPCHNHFPYSICALPTLMLSLYILLYLHFIPAMRLSILKVKLFPYWTHFGCIYLDGMFLFIVNVTWKICMWYCHGGRESEWKGRTDRRMACTYTSDVPFMRTIHSYNFYTRIKRLYNLRDWYGLKYSSKKRQRVWLHLLFNFI